MRDRPFEQLRTILLDRGVSARYADRLVSELEDHYDDARAERLAAGEGAPDRAPSAVELLGPDTLIAAQVLERPELRGRCCGVRAALRPMLVTLGSVDRTWDLARWSASITFGSMVTCALLLAMARTLALGV